MNEELIQELKEHQERLAKLEKQVEELVNLVLSKKKEELTLNGKYFKELRKNGLKQIPEEDIE